MTGPLRPDESGERPPEQSQRPEQTLRPEKTQQRPERTQRPEPSQQPDHETLRGLLGAWALNAVTAVEADLLEQHLAGCSGCADEAGRLRDAAGWLSADEPLDPAPKLRRQVLARALSRRPARIRVPDYADAYVTETARLDALLRDLGELDWLERADLPWHGGTEQWRPAEVLCHLTAVDGVLSRTLGLPDPVPTGAAVGSASPTGGIDLMERTGRLMEAYHRRSPDAVRSYWREQTRALVETAALAEAAAQDTAAQDDGGDGASAAVGAGAADLPVDYGQFTLPLRDAFLDRAFECWVHADDIAEAVGWPYGPPRGAHIRQMVGLAARLLPYALAGLRNAGQASFISKEPSAGDPHDAGAVKLIIEGRGESEWLIPLEVPGPDAPPLPTDTVPVATLAIDGVEFCFLCAAHREPERLPCGVTGDRAAARDVLHAARLLSRP
jgi:hypothetical protein